MFKRLFFGAASLLLPLVSGQSVPNVPAIIASDVRVTPPDYTSVSSSFRNGQMEMRGTTMLTLILRAYATETDRIIGGPRRLELDKYDVIVKVPPDTKADVQPAIVKALLADRFKLVVREETRPMQSYALVLGKGKHKLKPAEGGETRCNSAPGPSGPQTMHLTCKGYSTTMLTTILRSLGSNFITSPVADQTGLQGTWDFEMDVPPPIAVLGGGSSSMLVDAVENQLGLKLEQKRTDQPVIVIESVNIVPTPNEPGVEKLMNPPPPPLELEVATVRPSAPGAPQGGIRLNSSQEGGMQIEARGMRLSNLITLAWGLPVERIVGLPTGADDPQFDVVAKMSGQPGALTTNILAVLKGLVTERFQLVAHLEDRPMDAYKLVAVKPKMAKADPENRASCKTGPAPGAKDPREVTPGRTALYTCRNLTMDEFAERLQGLSVGFLRNAPVNATNLEGMFDFTLNFTPQLPTAALAAAQVALTGGASAPVAVGGTLSTGPAALAAADPSDNITFQEALNSQLGLKLELEKRPMPVLVIDRLEKTPTEN